MQVLDLSAIGAQAIARVERAQRAARDQLVAAMNQRPKLALKLELEGPKVAVPVPGTGEEGALQAHGFHLALPHTSLCLTYKSTPGAAPCLFALLDALPIGLSVMSITLKFLRLDHCICP